MTTPDPKDTEDQLALLAITNQWDDHGAYTKCFTNQMCSKCSAIKALLTTQLDNLMAELPKKSHLQDNPDNLDWIDQWNAVRQQRNTVITEVTEAIKRQREAL